jgi:hypothetical protein
MQRRDPTAPRLEMLDHRSRSKKADSFDPQITQRGLSAATKTTDYMDPQIPRIGRFHGEPQETFSEKQDSASLCCRWADFMGTEKSFGKNKVLRVCSTDSAPLAVRSGLGRFQGESKKPCRRT